MSTLSPAGNWWNTSSGPGGSAYATPSPTISAVDTAPIPAHKDTQVGVVRYLFIEPPRGSGELIAGEPLPQVMRSLRLLTRTEMKRATGRLKSQDFPAAMP